MNACAVSPLGRLDQPVPPDSPLLSICIPTYNFAAFLPATLRSILAQDGSDEVDIVVLDGASTDETPDIMAQFCAKYQHIRYHRLASKGGIDRDMATVVALASGEYCWLFSSDDIMSDGALRVALNEIRSGFDLYLCKHMECLKDMSPLWEHPILRPDTAGIFELSNEAERIGYFERAVNSEAFFSFMGGLIVKRSTWNRIPLNEAFVGSCWAHVARFFELMRSGLRVRYTGSVFLQRRGENDSFSDKGLVKRYQLQVEGFHKLADRFFGHDSREARAIRRAILSEFNRHIVLRLKYRAATTPHLENKQLLDHLVDIGYADFSLQGQITKLLYRWLPLSLCRRYYP
jgi:abequosyltransferase